jgi:hypothetical protein
MTSIEADKQVQRYRDQLEEARRAFDQELRAVLPRVATKDVDRLRKAETHALKLLILAEIYAGLIRDPDATASWLDELVQAGEIE